MAQHFCLTPGFNEAYNSYCWNGGLPDDESNQQRNEPHRRVGKTPRRDLAVRARVLLVVAASFFVLLISKEAIAELQFLPPDFRCPYSCDPIEALSGLKLSGPKAALGGLVFFLAAMYFSDKGLERRPFGAQHIGCWLMAMIGASVFIAAVIPFILRAVWPFLAMASS